MSESDTVAMLQTLDVNGPGKSRSESATGEEAPSEREVALHTMLLHSNQDASALFLLQGGAMSTLLAIAEMKDPNTTKKETLLAMKALTNLAALPQACGYMLEESVITSILFIGSRKEEDNYSAEARLQALRCFANLATTTSDISALAKEGVAKTLVEVVSHPGQRKSAAVSNIAEPTQETEWRVLALKIISMLCAHEAFRAELLQQGVENTVVDCLLEEPSKRELQLSALQIYRSIIMLRDNNQALVENMLQALLKLLQQQRELPPEESASLVEEVLSTFLILYSPNDHKHSVQFCLPAVLACRIRKCGPKTQLLNGGILQELALIGMSNAKGTGTRDKHSLDILLNLSAAQDAEDAFLASGIIDMLVQFLSSALQDPGVTTPSMVYAVTVVMNTCAGEDHVKQSLLQKGVVECLLPCLQDSAVEDLEAWRPLCLQATKALMNLSIGAGIAAHITERVTMGHVARLATRAFDANQRLCALRLLGNLCAEGGEARDAAASAEIVAILLQALTTAPEDGAAPAPEEHSGCLEAMRLLMVLALTPACLGKLLAAGVLEELSAWLVLSGAAAGAEAVESCAVAMSILLSLPGAARRLATALDGGDAARRGDVSSAALQARLEELMEGEASSLASLAKECLDKIARGHCEEDGRSAAGTAEAGAASPTDDAAPAASHPAEHAADPNAPASSESMGAGGSAAAAAGADATMLSVGVPAARVVPFDEIATRTEGFAPQYLIGRGRGWGAFAAETLEQMPPCAVKPLGLPEVGGEVEKMLEQAQEVAPCRHEGVVPLLGSALQAGEHPDRISCLLTPLCRGGSLQLKLFPPQQSEIPVCLSAALHGGRLGWQDLFRILVQAARGLAFLHTPDVQTDKPGFLHGSVNPSNILLDEHLNGRLADGFLGRFNTPEATMHVARQSLGFLDPAFARSGLYDATTDGYGLGMTMLVALTGQAAMDSEWAEPDLVDRCDEALYGGDTARCLALADAQAGWPEPVTLGMVGVIAGLLHRRKAARVSVPEACRRLEALMQASGLSWGLRVPEGARVCGFCLGGSNVRFGCGHAICCTNCLGGLVRSSAALACPVCLQSVQTIGIIQPQ